MSISINKLESWVRLFNRTTEWCCLFANPLVPKACNLLSLVYKKWSQTKIDKKGSTWSGFISCHMEMVQPNSLAAVSRNLIESPFDIRLWASHVKHFSMSACQSMTSRLKYWKAGSRVPFIRRGLWLHLIEPVCRMSRRTEMLRARTCALGWERHLMVAGTRHCMWYIHNTQAYQSMILQPFKKYAVVS